MSSSKYAMSNTTVTATGYNVPADFSNGSTWSEQVTISGTITSSSTTRTVTSQINYAVNCTAAGTASVTVPAGTFTAVEATCTRTVGVSALVAGTPMPAGVPSTASVTDYYAKGVGLVKSVSVSAVEGTETIVLTAYTVK
jgi:hypothetical protein